MESPGWARDVGTISFYVSLDRLLLANVTILSRAGAGRERGRDDGTVSSHVSFDRFLLPIESAQTANGALKQI